MGDSRNKCHGYGTVHSGYVGSVGVERFTRAVWNVCFGTILVAGRVSLTIKCPVRTETMEREFRQKNLPYLE